MISFSIDDLDLLKNIVEADIIHLQLAIGLALTTKNDQEVKFSDGREFIIIYHDK